MTRLALIGIAALAWACEDTGTVPDCPPLEDHPSQETFETWLPEAIEAGCWTAMPGPDTGGSGPGGSSGSGGAKGDPGGGRGGASADGR